MYESTTGQLNVNKRIDAAFCVCAMLIVSGAPFLSVCYLRWLKAGYTTLSPAQPNSCLSGIKKIIFWIEQMSIESSMSPADDVANPEDSGHLPPSISQFFFFVYVISFMIYNFLVETYGKSRMTLPPPPLPFVWPFLKNSKRHAIFWFY